MAKKLKTTRRDVTEHLRGEADMTEYLQAMIDESRNDPKMIAVAIGDIARARGMTAVARETHITREALYRALSPDGNPEFATVVKVVEVLHLMLAARPATWARHGGRSARGRWVTDRHGDDAMDAARGRRRARRGNCEDPMSILGRVQPHGRIRERRRA